MDSLTPYEITQKANDIGSQKVNNQPRKTLLSSILAGMFISLGAVFSISSTSGINGDIPFGVIKIIAGITFCIGLILVIIAGAELFTGNSLIIISRLNKHISTSQIIKNLTIVRLGNFIGSLIIIALTYFGGWHLFGSGAILENIVNIGIQKTSYGFIQSLCLGILCNILVCLGIRLAWSGKSNSDKILGIIFPITAFVASGFEHSVANMFYLPFAYILKTGNFISSSIDTTSITLQNIFINNLIPVTIGNLIGGMVFVGLIYWLIYKNKKSTI